MDSIPKLRIQRQGAKWRIVYDETRCLATFQNGKPVDDGGFQDEWEGARKKVDGQQAAIMKMSEVMDGKTMTDHEAEGVGN